MTEQEWLTCADPQGMLEFLWFTATERKLRLFACACCRTTWAHGVDQRSREAVEAAEQYADGLISADQLYRASQATERLAFPKGDARRDRNSPHLSGHQARAARVADAASRVRDGWDYRVHVEDIFRVMLEGGRLVGGEQGQREAEVTLAGLMREVFGNPLHPAVLDPGATKWNDGAVRKIAQSIYDDRSFDQLPVLADALEEAGCTDADMLGHCRGPGPHMLGCWLVDALLGRT